MSKRAIFQVCIGEQSKSKLYERCINSVKEYCDHHDIEHIILREPKLMIRPDVFAGNRSTESYAKHGGYLPIYEKEVAFDLMDEYDQMAIVDADIYIRPYSPNIFDEFGTTHAWGSVVEREMPLTDQYTTKIKSYSAMQYGKLNTRTGIDFKPKDGGFEFFNMGMIIFNCDKLKPYLNGNTAKEFIQRYEFADFVDGVGAWKWSTDQTLLNFFLKKYDVPTKHMSWKWNGLYSANTKIDECHFVHFFLKDHLPAHGEDVDLLMSSI